MIISFFCKISVSSTGKQEQIFGIELLHECMARISLINYRLGTIAYVAPSGEMDVAPI